MLDESKLRTANSTLRQVVANTPVATNKPVESTREASETRSSPRNKPATKSSIVITKTTENPKEATTKATSQTRASKSDANESINTSLRSKSNAALSSPLRMKELSIVINRCESPVNTSEERNHRLTRSASKNASMSRLNDDSVATESSTIINNTVIEANADTSIVDESFENEENQPKARQASTNSKKRTSNNEDTHQSRSSARRSKSAASNNVNNVSASEQPEYEPPVKMPRAGSKAKLQVMSPQRASSARSLSNRAAAQPVSKATNSKTTSTLAAAKTAARASSARELRTSNRKSK
jgi:hypothetical protein